MKLVRPQEGGGLPASAATVLQGHSERTVVRAPSGASRRCLYTTVAPGLVEPRAWSFNPTPSVTTGSGSGRAVPDVSADADPETGYLLYERSFATATPAQPVLQGGWGGTSFVSPQMNGSTAVIDSYLGHRVGLWNPSIYVAAVGSNSPFTPLSTASTGNDNIYYTGNPGEPYNQGAGLGIPNLTELAGDFTR